ncbi:hypothetical protein SAMN04515668_1997 [Hymenobacter arizonensis]|uniref:Uncharacterized protein n=1 Tax=Hymenobacter arizonensis TaxID=1227077 RepID=A0A1I5XQZ1_HYMAR|nr:hypothetical protein SAMN04515668_1997 [Hymenobacter arizonensis]
MKPNPIFLLGMTLVTLCGSASAQTTPTPVPNTPPGKGVPTPKRTAAPPRTASVSAVKIDTAAFRRSGRPYDSVINHARDIPSKKKN